jgi:hypothetical protein
VNETPVAPPRVATRHHLAAAVKFSPAAIRRDMQSVEGFNAKFAVLITGAVGTMACAYLFTVIALVSLPAILIQANVLTKSDVPTFLTKPGLILIVAWIAQTFIQLVLLSIIMVGQDVQSKAADARSQHTFEDTEAILRALDLKVSGGITDLRDELVAHIDKRFGAT